MINTALIDKKVNEVIKKHGTKNPTIIAKYEGIYILPQHYKKQLGAFIIVNKMPFIFIKDDLDEDEKNRVLSHELGHYFLHKQILKNLKILRDHSLFDKADNVMEQEANHFMNTLLNY